MIMRKVMSNRLYRSVGRRQLQVSVLHRADNEHRRRVWGPLRWIRTCWRLVCRAWGRTAAARSRRSRDRAPRRCRCVCAGRVWAAGRGVRDLSRLWCSCSGALLLGALGPALGSFCPRVRVGLLPAKHPVILSRIGTGLGPADSAPSCLFMSLCFN